MASSPLQSNWKLWKQTIHNSKDPKCDDYVATYVDGGDIKSIGTLYGQWKQLTKDIEASKKEFKIFISRSNVQPMWEDPANINGGSWNIKLGLIMNESLQLWLKLALAVVTEKFPGAATITGITISARQWGCAAQIWNSSFEDEHIRAITAQIEKIVGPGRQVKYRRHPIASDSKVAESEKVTQPVNPVPVQPNASMQIEPLVNKLDTIKV